ncbi:hypothetical protein V2J09_009305 [Rumex salicifolius]
MLSLKRSKKSTTTTRSRLSCDNEATISGGSYDIPIPYYLGRGEEANIQLITSRSIKLKTRKSLKFPRRQWSKTRFNKASIFRTDGELPQGNGMEEGTSSYYATKNQKSNSLDAPGLKPVRALWKIPSLRQRRLLIKKQSKSLSCSSTIESSKFVDINSGRYSKPEVCQYKYCSVHGSLHASSPPLALSSNKKKRRRWKHYPMVEKVPMLQVTTKDHADPSDKIGSGMWKLIYNHFLVDKNEVTSEVCEAGGDEDDTYTDLFSYKSKQSPKNDDTNLVYQVAENEKPEFSQGEAVEFVQQAVDEILLFDEQMSFHHPRDLNDTHHVKDSSAIMFPKPQSSKGFKKIRQLIATTKFIKAMQKLRKDTAENAPNNLFLAHLSTDKRKGTEEWMLDVALQQVISKLDPAQQRRVGMLIEAFESVTQDTKIYSSSESMPLELDENCNTEYGEDHVRVEPNDKESLSQIYVESRGTPDNGGAKSMMKVNQEIVYGCKVDASVGKDSNFHFDKEKFTNVWHQVYHHFVASEAIESGNAKNNGVEVKKQNVDEIKNDTGSGHLNHDHAIQLVQEAIDELIHLQEQLSDQLSSELHNNEKELSSSEFAKQNLEASDKAGTESDGKMPFQQQKSKAYNKLRKMVVSAKFISAMEKVRKINPHKPQKVSLEAERVYLRHWSMEDRKMSEERMLDCALQEVIIKLAPSQKKKVAMLTQAFETFSSEINKGFFVEKTNPLYDTGSTNITENEQKKSVIIDQDNLNVYKYDIQTPDDEVPCFLKDALEDNPQPGDNRNEAFDDEFDMELYYNNVELSSVNLHIHEMGSTKGCLVCHPHKFPEDDKEENEINIQHQLEAPTDETKHESEVKKDAFLNKSFQSRDLGDNINSYDGNGSFLDDNKCTNMWHLIHQQSEISTNEHSNMDDVNTKDTELQQNEAIKFVQEAVDEILQMPEKTCDDQSIIPEDKSLRDVNGSYKAMSNVILCKKFVKAIEKMKKQRSKVGSRQLESTPKSIHPKQQKENEMKNDQLMLDYALQRVISNLGPAQKKKVAMLVEAFERVAQ